MLARLRSLTLPTLLTGLMFAPMLAGPPWISIEYPVNPHDRSMQGAMLLVHVFHHATPMNYPVTGTAEGIVNGERKTSKLRFTDTARTGVYGLSRQWGEEGVWTLVIRMTRGGEDGATAVVELGPSGEVASVRVPTRRDGSWTVPTDVSMSDVDRDLRARASALASRR